VAIIDSSTGRSGDLTLPNGLPKSTDSEPRNDRSPSVEGPIAAATLMKEDEL
jgi:hypothetical protein